MGLLDSLFDPGTYSGQQGGLLDFIKQMQQQQAVQQGGQGFGQPQPQSAPPQAPPIQVGGVQMPRMGSPDQFTPQAPQMPPQVANANAQAPAPEQQQLPPAFGQNYLDRVNAGGGLIRSLFGATPQQQNLKAQYDATRSALVDAGNDEKQASSLAMLAVMNPEAAKTVLPEALTKRADWGVISEDPLTGKQYGWINKNQQTINGKEVGAQGAVQGTPGLQGMTDRISAMRTQGASKEDMLRQIPTGWREDVDSLLTGKAVPANMGRAGPKAALLTLAKTVDPNFDETLIPTRVQMRKDFAGEGKNGQAIGALNTVQHHAGQVSDAIEEFEKAGGGGDYPLLNAGKLMIANQTGMNPQLRDAAQKLQDKLNATEHEVASAYNAGHITDSDRKTWNEIKASNLPANQLKQKLADFVDLLDGKRDSLNHMYQQTFHEDAPAIDKETNAATSAKIHSRLANGQSSYSASPSSKPATVIQNGHTYNLQPDGSYK